jgi:hypothetical protein
MLVAESPKTRGIRQAKRIQTETTTGYTDFMDELIAHGALSGDAVRPSKVRRIGPWKTRVLLATHNRLVGNVPFKRLRTRGSRDPEHGAPGLTRTAAHRSRALATAICFTVSSGQLFPAFERRVSIWATHESFSCVTRVRTGKSGALNPPRLFSPMDTAESSETEIP